MDSNSTNLTQENMTNDTSLTSSVSKQNGTMTVKMDLIPKVEKNKDIHSAKAKTIKERLMDFIQYFGKLFKKAPQNDIEAQKPRSSWRCDCFSSINKDCLTSLFNGLIVFLSLTILVLVFMLILAVFWSYFKTFVFESPLDKFWFIYAIISIIGLFCALYVYFLILYTILIERQFNSISKELITSIYTKISVFFIIIFFILAFVFILILFYIIFETIIFDDTFTQNKIICAILALIGFCTFLIFFCFSLYHALMDCPQNPNCIFDCIYSM